MAIQGVVLWPLSHVLQILAKRSHNSSGNYEPEARELEFLHTAVIHTFWTLGKFWEGILGV